VHPTVLGAKKAEMRIIGCDLHARQQTVAMLDTTAGELVKMTLKHEAPRCASFTQRFGDRCVWELKPWDPCRGL